MKASKLREKSTKELLSEKEKLIKELSDLRFKKIIGVVENPAKFKLLKKDIARINTIITERKIEELKQKIK